MNQNNLVSSSPKTKRPTTNQQTETDQTVDQIWKLAKDGAYLTPKQLSRITNLPYYRFTGWRTQGLELLLVGGKIRYDRFIQWVEIELPKLNAEQAAEGQRLPKHFLKHL